MIANIFMAVLGGIVITVCLVIASGISKDDKDKKVIGVLLVLMALCMGLIFSGGFFTGTGRPACMGDVSKNPIYAIQARFPYNDGINGVIVIKDAERPDSKFQLVEYKMKELPDANLVRVKDNKFIPFTLCQKTQ